MLDLGFHLALQEDEVLIKKLKIASTEVGGATQAAVFIRRDVEDPGTTALAAERGSGASEDTAAEDVAAGDAPRVPGLNVTWGPRRVVFAVGADSATPPAGPAPPQDVEMIGS